MKNLETVFLVAVVWALATGSVVVVFNSFLHPVFGVPSITLSQGAACVVGLCLLVVVVRGMWVDE